MHAKERGGGSILTQEHVGTAAVEEALVQLWQLNVVLEAAKQVQVGDVSRLQLDLLQDEARALNLHAASVGGTHAPSLADDA